MSRWRVRTERRRRSQSRQSILEPPRLRTRSSDRLFALSLTFHRKSNFHQYQANKSAGPSAPGSKEIPEGEPNCLAGLKLVFTGELSSLARDEAVELAKRYGACVDRSSISSVRGSPSHLADFYHASVRIPVLSRLLPLVRQAT